MDKNPSQKRTSVLSAKKIVYFLERFHFAKTIYNINAMNALNINNILMFVDLSFSAYIFIL